MHISTYSYYHTHLRLWLWLRQQLWDEIEADVNRGDTGHNHRQQFGWVALKVDELHHTGVGDEGLMQVGAGPDTGSLSAE